jgi:aryl-alcohol dehydrogenase-like predicted oxidoreductase
VGVGAWSWGDRSGYWGYGKEYGRPDNRAAFQVPSWRGNVFGCVVFNDVCLKFLNNNTLRLQALIDNGLTFIDTAEVYGFGKSEEFTGEFIRETNTAPVIATKFAPLPWRFTSDSVVTACKASLSRLQQKNVGLYMIHW